MQEHPVYFTVQTLNNSGIGDQLGTQFSRLYSLASSLGMQYLYSPLYTPRSITPAWMKKTKQFFFRVRCFIYFHTSNKNIFRLINKAMEKAERAIDSSVKSTKDESFAAFAGLKNDSLQRFQSANPGYVAQEIILSVLLDNGLVKNGEDLKNHINKLIRQAGNSAILFSFNWAENMHQHIDKIDTLLAEMDIKKEEIALPFFSENFWKDKGADTRPANKVVVHIRCGDSTIVDLGTKKLIVNAENVYADE